MPRTLVSTQSFKTSNLLINSGMDFWQRTTASVASTSTPAYQSVDRWQFETGGAGSANITRSTDLPGPQWGSYSVVFTQVGAGATSHRLWQRIEAANIAPYIGQTLTLSFWTKASAVNGNTAFQTILAVPVTTPDVWPSENTAATEIMTLSEPSSSFTAGVWKRFSYNFVVPASAIRGLCVGLLGISDTAGHAWSFAAPMLTALGAPDQLIRAGNNLEDELALCQRYFNSPNSNNLGSTDTSAPYGHGFVQTTTSARCIIPLPVTMRAQPTLAGDSSNAIVYANTNTPVVSMTIADNGLSAVTIAATTAAVLTVGQGVHLRKNGAAGYIWLSAEL